MFFKRKYSYNYIPSYIFKTGSKYKQLTDSYQEIFEKYSEDNKSLDSKEKELFFLGIKHCSEYLLAGFFYSVKEDFDSKTNQEKIISAIYYRLTKLYGTESELRDKITETLLDLAESSFYYSLGVDNYKNRSSFIWDKKNSKFKNIIKHTSEVVFKSLVFDFMKEKSEIINLTSESNELNIDQKDIEPISSELSGEQMILKSGLKRNIPPEIQTKICLYLDENEDKYEPEIKKYLEVIYKKLKESNNI